MKSVLISGAGIAGPSLAYWLNKYGIQVTIVEKANGIRNAGYAVDFRGNAIKILDKMGILDEIKKKQTHTGDVSFVDKNGKRLVNIPSIFLSGELEILRGDLGEILYELTKDTTTYLFGDAITAIQEKEKSVVVSFEKHKMQTFDLVIGADGTHSHVRSLVFGDETQFIKHLGYGISIFTIENYLNISYTGQFFATSGKLAAMYSSRDNSEAKALLYFSIPKTFISGRDNINQKSVIEEIFAKEDWEVPNMISKMKSATDFYFDTIDQICMQKWSKGRIVLVGDAAYSPSPLSGMGTGLAVVGAYVLAKEIERSGDDLSKAFTFYEQKMLPYVKSAQRIPRILGPLIIPQSQVIIFLRIILLRIIVRLKLEKIIARLGNKPSESVNIQDF